MRKPAKSQSRLSTPETVNVCFEFTSATASKVCLAGSFNDWSIEAMPMVRLGEDRWVKNLTLPPGRYEYRFVVDGQWVDDSRASEFVPNSHGGVNAVMTVSSRT